MKKVNVIAMTIFLSVFTGSMYAAESPNGNNMQGMSMSDHQSMSMQNDIDQMKSDMAKMHSHMTSAKTPEAMQKVMQDQMQMIQKCIDMMQKMQDQMMGGH